MRNGLRVLVLLVLTFGVIMLLARYVTPNNQSVLAIGDDGYTAVRVMHIVLAIGVVGLYEAVMARRKRAAQFGSTQIGMVGRVVLTTTLVIGLFLLLSLAFDLITGGAYSAVVWVHAALGLASVALTEVVFSTRRARAA